MAEQPTEIPARRHLRIWLIPIGALLLAAGWLAAWAAVGDGVPRGTQLAGIDLSGMRSSEARDAIYKYSLELTSRPVTLALGKQSLELNSQQLDLHVDNAATMAALPVRSWNPVWLIRHLLGGAEVDPVIYSGGGLEVSLQTLAVNNDIPAVDAEISFRNGKPVVSAASEGQLLDQAAAKAAILDAARHGFAGGPIKLKFVTAKPAISAEVAQEFVDGPLKQLLSGPVTVSVSDDPTLTNSFAVTDLRAAIRFKLAEGKLQAFLDPATLASRADGTFISATQPVKDATWDVSSGVPVVVPSQSGFGVSDERLAEAVESVWQQPAPNRSTTVSFGPLDPKLSTAAVQALGVRELVSSYTQNFPAAAYRSINIGQAAKYVNGTLLLPGDVFSMNNTIKERTEANGYTSGWIIGPGGVFQYEPGGGVSTATTATFNAAWYAGMKFLEWRAHSIYISRYPAGREATVSWGSLDMRFQNDSDTAIFITTQMTRTSVTVKFWGTKHWEKIDSVFGARTDLTNAGVVYNTAAECHSQDAVPGFRITVWRTFYQGGVVVKREPFKTRYAATPKVICSAQPTATPTPKPTPKPTATKTPKPSATPSPTAP